MSSFCSVKPMKVFDWTGHGSNTGWFQADTSHTKIQILAETGSNLGAWVEGRDLINCAHHACSTYGDDQICQSKGDLIRNLPFLLFGTFLLKSKTKRKVFCCYLSR